MPDSSHPIPARGETTPTDEPPTLRSLWGKYPGLERADDDAELLAQIAALTSEVSALREAVEGLEDALAKRCLADMNAAREHPNDWPAGQEWDELVGSSQAIFRRRAREEAAALRAARRDGAP